MAFTPHGFYAVLDRDDEDLARMLVGPGNARVLQVRCKPADPQTVVRVARMARRVCDELKAALVVNDRVDIALAVGADGVHLGQTDLPIDAARRLAGKQLMIGVSTHNIRQVEQAVLAGADYLGFGPIFATTTKQAPDPCKVSRGCARRSRRREAHPLLRSAGSRLPRPFQSIWPGLRRSVRSHR